jgi:hypothetical protein
MIPLLLEPAYVSDGWLGAMVGSRLWYDMTDDVKFETTMANLIKALGDKGKVGGAKRIAAADGEAGESCKLLMFYLVYFFVFSILHALTIDNSSNVLFVLSCLCSFQTCCQEEAS